MAEFIIAPHMRLHEWIAVEKGRGFNSPVQQAVDGQ